MRKSYLLAVGAGLLLPAAAHAQASYGFATYAARINSLGQIVNSSGVASSSRTGTGLYDVVFARDVTTSCVPVASVFNASGFATVTAKSGSTTTFSVVTLSTSGTPADRAFAIIVSCGP